jgi:soluble lytic murein transglycosylase-like protein
MKLKIMVAALLLACVSSEAWGTDSKRHDSTPNELVQLVADMAQEHNVPFSLAYAVIRIESNFNPRARSGPNLGLGQIQCKTARQMGFVGKCSQLYDARVNLKYTLAYLREKLSAADGDACLAAAMYNNGSNTARKDSKYCRKVQQHMDVTVAALNK